MVPGSSFSLGSVRGIKLGIHYSWLIAAVLLTWSLARGWFPQLYPGWDEATYFIAGGIATLLLFASVLLHEFGHALTALRFGIPVRSIVLFIFGGVASLERESDRPGAEFWVAVMGPAVSLALAVLFYLLRFVVGPLGEPVLAIVTYLAVVNALLLVFNLIPGFPLDGGRILRALVWAVTGSYKRATWITSVIGQGVAFLLIFWGVSRILGGNLFGGIWTAFIGWFLLNAASMSYRQAELQDALAGITVGQLARTDPPTAPPRLSLAELVYGQMLPNATRAHLVVDDGQFVGLITLTDVLKHGQDEWGRVLVADVMTPAGELQTVRPDTPLTDALQALAAGDYNQLPVLDGDRLVGLLTRSTVLRFLQLRTQLGIEGDPAAAAGRPTPRPARAA